MALSIVGVGDSNTAGFGLTAGQVYGSLLEAALDAAYAETYSWTNYGVSWSSSFNWRPDSAAWGPGAPTHNGQQLFSSVMALNPDIILYNLGTNDASSRTKAQYKGDVEAFIVGAQAHTFAHAGNPLNHPLVVLVDAPVAAQASFPTDGTANPAGTYLYGRPSARLTEYRDSLDELAVAYTLPRVRAYDQFAAIWNGSSNTSTSFMQDGVHLNATGHTMLSTWSRTTMDAVLEPDGTIALPTPPLTPSPINYRDAGAWLPCTSHLRANGAWT